MNYIPTKKEKELVKRVEGMFGIAEQAKQPVHRNWRESEKLYLDKHWDLDGMPKNQNQITLNLISSAIDTMIPILSSRPPKIDVLPTSAEAEDAEVAKVMQSQLDDLWELRDMQNVIPEFLLDYLVYGTGIMKLHFGDDDLPDCDTVDPFNFFVNPMATRMEDAQWVIYAAPVLVCDIKEKYENGKYVKPQSNLSDFEAMKPNQDYAGNAVVTNLEGESYRYKDKDSAVESLEERALVIECWYRDGDKDYIDGEDVSKYPGARLTTIANGVLLYDGKTPYPFLNNEFNMVHPFPFVVGKNGSNAHSFWGNPEPSRLKTINLSLDKVASQVMDNIALMANPVWVVDENTGVKEQIINRPGSIIRKQGPGTVDMKSPSPMPAYVFNFMSLMESMFEVISGVNRATQGREAPNVTSGVQAEVYRRAATSKIDFKSRSIDTVIQQLGAAWLAMIQNLGVEEHRVTVPDDLGDTEFAYTGIRLQDKPMRVRAKPGSMMPDNKQYIEEKILALAQMGIIQDPEFIIDNVELPNKQVILNKMQEQRAIQEEAEQQVAMEDMATNDVFENSTDEDEILSVLEQNPELMDSIN